MRGSASISGTSRGVVPSAKVSGLFSEVKMNRGRAMPLANRGRAMPLANQES